MCQLQEMRDTFKFHRHLKLTDKLKPFSRQFSFTLLVTMAQLWPRSTLQAGVCPLPHPHPAEKLLSQEMPVDRCWGHDPSLMGWWPLGNWTLGPHVRFTQNRRLASFSESTTQGNFRFFSLICLKSSLVCGKRHIDHLVLLAIEFSFVISPVPTYSFFPRNSRPVWPLL